MAKVSKLLAICLTVVIAFTLAGCTENNGSQKDNSDVSSVVSSENVDSDNSGIELPDQEFTSDNQSAEPENTTTNKEDDANTSSSTQDNNKNEESSSDAGQSSISDDGSKEDVSSDDEQQNESSDDTINTPSKNEDGSIELPMDKW